MRLMTRATRSNSKHMQRSYRSCIMTQLIHTDTSTVTANSFICPVRMLCFLVLQQHMACSMKLTRFYLAELSTRPCLGSPHRDDAHAATAAATRLHDEGVDDADLMRTPL